ncbi:hypothetical protein SPHINGOR109_10534 [Sphingorhabdus sp. 109]|nr:hypothetical protein SPHINGOR109_10534 [Sphingorhabdus sp. 109]
MKTWSTAQRERPHIRLVPQDINELGGKNSGSNDSKISKILILLTMLPNLLGLTCIEMGHVIKFYI